ncbi:T6SS immunity protein Tli4 family protein [Rosenbergiella nectarea]|uniref:T6SS immunity protein Tli4 family protein n=1 Tax=Rosenbergiella nectarea TaxID=988801 RepID=UPI001F4D793F|nr:T6SS immunity protein Tli4 family protein [Rosenbergiella nectarea]
MKKFPFHLLIPLALLLLAAGLYIHHYVTFVHTPPALTDKEKRMVDTLFTTTKAQCVGRYVFEVPASFENTLTDRARINEVSISSKRLYRPAFVQRIRLREEVLKNSHTVDPIDQPFLKQVYRVSENAVIFDRNRNESVPGFGRILEGHLYVEGVAFIISSEIRDVSDPKYKQDRVEYLNGGMAESKLNTKPQKLAELQDLMSRLSGRKDDEIPTQPGACISQGFIRDGSAKPKEDITFVYPHNPVFSLSVSTNTYLGDPKSMLERSHEIQPYLTEVKAKTLRKSKTQIAGFEADEWLNVAPSEKSPGHPSGQLLFNAIANEKIVDFRHPIIDLTLSNHTLPPPTYSDSELVEIWDRITGSFRLRNNAF